MPKGRKKEPFVELPGEQWLPMVDYADLYRVSNLGRVWSIKGHRFLPGTPKLKTGYIEIGVYRNKKQKTKQVHREIIKAFVGPIPPGMQVRHLNGLPADNRLENLAIGTPQENQDDRRQEGYLGKKLLDTPQMLEINKLVAQRRSVVEIAKELDLSVSAVYSYANNRPTYIKRGDVYKMVIAGAKVELIAEYYGTTHTAICSMMKRHYEPVNKLRKRHSLNRSLTLADLHNIVR